MGQFEHCEIEAVKAGQSYELEPVAHLRDVVLEAREPLGSQLFAPIEARRAVVGQQFAGELAMDRIGKPLGFAEIGLTGLPPQEVGVGRIGEAACDRVFDAEPRANAEEPFRGALAADERAIAFVDVGGQ